MKKNTGFIEILLILSENKATKKRKVLILSNFTVEECFEFLKMERKWLSLGHFGAASPGPRPAPLPRQGQPPRLRETALSGRCPRLVPHSSGAGRSCPP